MEYNSTKKEITLNREFNELDKFVIDFCSILEEYVIVSGYVSILFGRSRATEDVDLLVPCLDENKFNLLWERIENAGFECLNTQDITEAFQMLKENAIRFSRKNKPLPNIEFKLIKNDIDKYSFKNKLKVNLKRGSLFISPIEMQIAYKLWLAKGGNEKDIEDSKHLYELFKEKLNKLELTKLVKELKVEKEFKIIQ